MKRQFKLSLTAFAIAQCLSLASAQAQETEKEQQDNTTKSAEVKQPEEAKKLQDIEVLTVQGFAATLQRSLQNKKLADSTVEVISVDDIGQLPDVTITDTLARLPGIAAERDRGNASTISIRGLGERLNLATMNGREIVSGEPSRSVRFEQFPAELINGVEVYKSPLASNIEGGIAGLVNMKFVDPLDRDKRQVNISGHVMDYPLADDIPTADHDGYRTSFSYVDPITDKFGVAFGVAYQDQPSIQRDVTSWSYNKLAAEQGDVNGNGVTEAAPWGAQTATKGGTNKRIGAMTVLQWLPTDRLQLKYDLFYSKFDIEEREDQLWFDGWGNWSGESNWNYQNASNPAQIITKPDGSEQIVAGGMLYGGSHTANNSTWFQKNALISTGLNAEWQGDDWTIVADVGYSQATIKSKWVNISSSYQNADAVANGMDYSWDARGEKLAIGSAYDIGNTADYQMDYLQVNSDRDLKDDMINARLDFSRIVDFGIIDKLSFGGRWADREKDNDVVSWQQAVLDGDANVDANTYSLGSGYNVPVMYTFKNWSQVVDNAFGGIDNRNQHDKQTSDYLDNWNVKETNSALYLMFGLSGELGYIPYTGNIGVRYVRTESTSSGFDQVPGTESVVPVSFDHDYDEILPSLNLRFSVTEDSQIRLGLSRAMSRPPLVEMRSGLGLNQSSTVNTASKGNPLLNPFVANQVDLGYEYYFADDAAFTVQLFFKDLKTHIGQSTSTMNVAGVDYQLTAPVNGDGGQIRGFELLYQQAFTMLPEPFDGLGIYANYSYTNSNVKEFEPADNPLSLGGLSKNVGNLTLWYSKYDVDAKVSYNYRSEYTRVGSWDPSELYTIGSEATVDASISYQLTENFKVMLQGQNLTNEASTSYFDNDPSRPRGYAEWGRRYLLGFQLSM
ncbi:TonB-dependent receptor [Shewanella sp. C32]|uniref:TonB-dependent receptor n=1 Tax=Shewanella electrica TaxID=515560 RepID=A0ABT2FIY9_9GAMM|nr:TonB-dependent receptor [Shewanella electrica]MCH1925356.1 TonB-dependent receptor [Shewanella electrica]MCS4555181.1 TonB-dependent receptor [Shewanella electrica]